MANFPNVFDISPLDPLHMPTPRAYSWAGKEGTNMFRNMFVNTADLSLMVVRICTFMMAS